MIMVELESPALERAGGIWQGMSGSPVYVDGQLLGAVAYGLSWGPSPIAGVTPFSEMDDYLAARRAPGAKQDVEVDDSDANRWAVAPGPLRALDRTIEPDLSNAGPFLALAAVTGGSVTVRDWPSETTQAGDAWGELLTAMGCEVEHASAGLRVTGPAPGTLQGLDVDLHDVGELTPVVAALCALATTPSHLRGVGHIRHHETDRLAALARELGGLGADVTEHPDGLSFRPAPLHGGLFHTYADHRMAHAGVVVGAAVDDVLVEDVATTAKTFTDFAGAWSALFGR